MSIRTLNIASYPQLFNVSLQNKHQYGEVNTDFSLVSKILKLIPIHKFRDTKLKWLDPCCGCGYFSIVLYKLLYKYIPILDDDERQNLFSMMDYFFSPYNSTYFILPTITENHRKQFLA